MRSRKLIAVLAFAVAALVFASQLDLAAVSPQAASPDTVYVNVNVTDSKNVPVTTLKAEHFQLLEENKEQKVTSFSAPGEPLTVNIILGLSALGPVKAVGQRDRITVDILGAVDRVREANSAATPAGFVQIPLDSDGLYGTVGRAITALEQEPSRRKALVVVGDGLIASGSSASSMQLPKNLIELARKTHFPVYFLFTVTSLPEPALVEASNYAAGYSLGQIADATGGDVIVGQIDNTLAGAAGRLRDTLKGQYVLGFTSTNAAKDGKWRKLTVKVNPPADLTKLKINAKPRYFVPKV